MAALDTPWMVHMSTPRSTPRTSNVDASPNASEPPASYAPPTYASFSPANLSSATSAAKRKSTVLVHQKSPLLLATPPQITRALAYSHPFLLPLNKLVGLLSWTTGDPWESFLLLVVFWAVVQYGDVLLRFAGPIVAVIGLIVGMYGRRYSPLSSSGWTENPNTAGKEARRNGGVTGGHQRGGSEMTSTRHQKTLDEIVDTVKVFTTRCNILMEPFLEMTDFLSTQRTATSATTRPALTTLFVRILGITPIWILLTLPPLRIITTKRVVLVFGTLALTWHSSVCRISRTLLWRSATIRRIARGVTGLPFEIPETAKTTSPNGCPVETSTVKVGTEDGVKKPSSALTAALKRNRSGLKDSGVRFTFILYENQRRWVGLGWTNSLFAYERAAWTDEQNNPMPSKDAFELPEVEDAPAKWRWVEGSKWRVDGVPEMDEAAYETDAARNGWIFYDNKWQTGRRGQDGWNRWTRRRKWYRDAELVEKSDDEHQDPTPTSPSPEPPTLQPRSAAQAAADSRSADASSSLSRLSSSNPEAATIPSSVHGSYKSSATADEDDPAAETMSTSTKSTSSTSRFRWPTPTRRRRPTGGSASLKQQQRSRRTSDAGSSHNTSADDDASFGGLTPALELEIQGHRKGQDAWGIGDEAQMGLE
ncbi:hypothetical protein DL769_000056 [Monosporascus sp. CRB-8-3]|nr:hypothetical protein DL769_000056 [Monosporascus sp. CRB-8-3]